MFRFHGKNDDDPIYFRGSQSSDGPKDYESNSFIFTGAVASLCIVITITTIFYYIYFRLCSNRPQLVQSQPRRTLGVSRARRFSWRAPNEHFFTSPRNGLCRAAVDALPVFVYKPENFEDGLSCAVCLCEFEENEKGRVLPGCNHSFHVDCIDMWFCSHSTCPLCREEVSVRETEANDRTLTGSSSSDAASSVSAEQPDNLHAINGDEEGIVIREYIAVIDIPATQK